GQYLACMLVSMRLRELWRPMLPGLRTAAFCMVATFVGKVVAELLKIHAPTVIVFVAAPATAAFLWLEAREAIRMATSTFRKADVLRTSDQQA
ncbi:MAG: hypothetical protein ACREQ4_08465, partial [Candidatus Binataceae bacterium]